MYCIFDNFFFSEGHKHPRQYRLQPNELEHLTSLVMIKVSASPYRVTDPFQCKQCVPVEPPIVRVSEKKM